MDIFIFTEYYFCNKQYAFDTASLGLIYWIVFKDYFRNVKHYVW